MLNRAVLAMLATMLLCSCATSVSQSLERRGVSPRAVALERIVAANDTAGRLREAMLTTNGAFVAVAAPAAVPLGERIIAADAACANAAREGQTLRMETRSFYEAADGWIGAEMAESRYGEATAYNLTSAPEWRSRLARLANDFDRALAASDAAVAACSMEADFLETNPGALAAATRTVQREALTNALADAVRWLNLARIEAESFASALEAQAEAS